MSKCISRHGEYSDHEGIGEYCERCGDCNHDRIRAKAWDEAADHLTQGITVDDAHMIGIAEELQQENPYRKENQ